MFEDKYVVIVDPLSSGIEIAPAFKKRGIKAIAVTLEQTEWPEFGSQMRASDFFKIFPWQPGIEKLLQEFDLVAVIPGTEEGIPFAEKLASILTPHLVNNSKKSLYRLHKYFMQMGLAEANVPCLRTLNTSIESDVEAWIQENEFQNVPLVLKPPMSSGSEMVFHVSAGGDWKARFREILQKPSVISGKTSETVVVQEQAIGTEYAVGTVSADGKHYLAHLIRYNKSSVDQRQTVFDHVEFVPFEEEVLGELWRYTQYALDALGVRWGAAHTEVMMTPDGPRLIETSPRIIGGPVVQFARAGTGSSQVDKLVEVYLDGDVQLKRYELKKTVVPVFLRAAQSGVVSNLQILEEVARLPSLLSRHLWIKEGDRVPQTVDYLTSIGIVALAGDRQVIFEDYKKVRALESQLVFTN